MTVGRLIQELPQGELQQQLAFDRLEPAPGERWAARICAVMANANGGKTGGGRFSEADFLMIRQTKVAQSAGVMRQKLTTVFGPAKMPDTKGA